MVLDQRGPATNLSPQKLSPLKKRRGNRWRLDRDEEFHCMLRKIFQISGALILLMLTGATLVIVERVTTAQEATRVPNFEMDPLFFQNLPNRWTTGQVSGISVD